MTFNFQEMSVVLVAVALIYLKVSFVGHQAVLDATLFEKLQHTLLPSNQDVLWRISV
jgi:hypothetical protein